MFSWHSPLRLDLVQTYLDILNGDFILRFQKKYTSIHSHRIRIVLAIHTKMPKEWKDGIIPYRALAIWYMTSPYKKNLLFSSVRVTKTISQLFLNNSTLGTALENLRFYYLNGRVDGKLQRRKNLRFRKYPDTCGSHSIGIGHERRRVM